MPVLLLHQAVPNKHYRDQCSELNNYKIPLTCFIENKNPKIFHLLPKMLELDHAVKMIVDHMLKTISVYNSVQHFFLLTPLDKH